MKFDVLLRTRDRDMDYRWVYCPSYVDQVTEKKMSFLIQMMQKPSLKQFLTEESLHNIYYIYDENGSVLIRSGFSGKLDGQGRNIYAVEGLACPPEENRIFWYALPYLIDRLSRTSLLRNRWMSDQIDTSHTKNRQIEFSSLTEDSLFMDGQADGSMRQQIQDKSPCMEKLMQDIRDSSEMFNFVFGTQNHNFYGVPVGRCYTPEELDKLEAVPVRKVQTFLHPVVENRENIYDIEIQVEKQGKRYGAFLMARDWQGDGIAETDYMSFGKDGIDLAQIEKARIAMDKKLGSVGYHRGRRREK